MALIVSFTSMPLGRIIYVPGATSALTNQPNVNYKWKIFIFAERLVDGDYDDGCPQGEDGFWWKGNGRNGFHYAKFLCD
jgi:hypothetical protein